MKNLRHILLLATILLLPLSLSAQNKGFQLPNKKQSATTKSGGNKSLNSSNKKQNGHSSALTKRQIPEVIQHLINNMVYVEGGAFTMGATAEQGSDAMSVEKPAHRVTLSSYYIGKYEVTQKEWEAVMGYNPSYKIGGNLPVESVSRIDCLEFISRLNAMTGKKFRLPTEAEWEFAARGGKSSKGYKYAGSDYLGNVAWYNNSSSITHPVGTKNPNELGLYDMSGNVWEWCQDWSGSYSAYVQTNPIGSTHDTYCICRGGCWDGFGKSCRVSYRCSVSPNFRSNNIGLRLAF